MKARFFPLAGEPWDRDVPEPTPPKLWLVPSSDLAHRALRTSLEEAINDPTTRRFVFAGVRFTQTEQFATYYEERRA